VFKHGLKLVEIIKVCTLELLINKNDHFNILICEWEINLHDNYIYIYI